MRGDALAGAGDSTRQIYRVAAKEDRAGAPERLTSADGGVDDFAWSPDGRFIAFMAPEPATDEDPVAVGQTLRYTRLGIVNVAEGTTSLITGREFDVAELAWSPNGEEIALVVAPTPRPEDEFHLALVVVSRRTGSEAKDLPSRISIFSEQIPRRCAPRDDRVGVFAGDWGRTLVDGRHG